MSGRILRPGWIAGLSFAAAALVGAWFPGNVLFFATLLCVAITVILLAVPSLRQFNAWSLIAFTVTLALAILWGRQTFVVEPLLAAKGSAVHLCGQMTEEGNYRYLTVESGDLPRGTRLALWASNARLEAHPFDQVDGMFTVCDPEDEGLEQRQREADGIWLAILPVYSEPATVTPGTPSLIGRFRELRDTLAGNITALLQNDDVGAVVTGIGLGADEELSARARNAFRACGVSHLFAVSGFHLAVITAALAALLRRLRLKRWLRAAISVFVIVFFALLVGGSASVIRAAVMCGFVLLGGCFRRRADARNSLGIALLFLLLLNPAAVYDVGLLLSFCATLGLVVLCPALTRKATAPFAKNNGRLSKAAKGVVTTMCVTVSASLSTLPVCLVFFGEFSAIAVIANLLTTLPASALLMVTALACILSPLSFAMKPLCFVAGWLSRYLLWITGWLSQIPVATVTVRDLYLIVWVFGSGILFGIGWYLRRGNGIKVAACVSLVALVIGITLNTLLMNGVTVIRAVPTSREPLLCMEREDSVTVVADLSDTDVLYDLNTLLRVNGLRHIDRLVIAGGDERVPASLPAVLGAYYSEKTAVWAIPRLAPYIAANDLVVLSETPCTLSDGVTVWTFADNLRVSVDGHLICYGVGSGRPSDSWAVDRYTIPAERKRQFR